MSGSNINTLMELWAAYSALRDPLDTSSLNLSPFSEYRDMYHTIDSIPIGGVPWQSATLSFDGPIPENPPSWMSAKYSVWFRDPRLLFKKMLKNPDFKHFFNYAPYRQYDTNGQRCYENFMSGDWAWKQAVSISSVFFHLQYITITNVSPRISSLRILRRMEHYLCRSSSVVIKRRFQWQPDTMNIGPSMLLSATSIIVPDVHMGMGLSLLDFYPYPKVTYFFLFLLLL
jgi:hypothetical protein